LFGEAVTAELPSLYLGMLSQEISRRIRSDPDFDEQRFPNAAVMFKPPIDTKK